jgi:RimJ/RimL family protein N-acetyltransferase
MRAIRRVPPKLILVSVYRAPKTAPPLLYKLLEEREAHVNISHRAMPSWKQHLAFIARRPYAAWYLIKSGRDYVGAIYLTAMNEIGVFVAAQFHGLGLGSRAVELLIHKHGRRRYLANINPRNGQSIQMFRKMGFRIAQQTYERWT